MMNMMIFRPEVSLLGGGVNVQSMGGIVDHLMNEWMNEWMDEWMDGWMNIMWCMYLSQN